MDIGTETIKFYSEEISKAEVIFVKGTIGYCEDKLFCKGTKQILEKVANSKGYSIIGGGHITTAIEKLNIDKKRFNYVSLSGGAMLQYISGKELPGLKVLEKENRKWNLIL